MHIKEGSVQKHEMLILEHTDVSDKDKRRAIHQLFKGSSFETDT